MNGTNIAQSRVLWHDSTFGKSLERPHVHNRFKSLQIRGDSAPDKVQFLLLLMLNIDSKMPSPIYILPRHVVVVAPKGCIIGQTWNRNSSSSR